MSAAKPDSRLRGLSGFLVRRPRLVLGAWVVAMATLAFVGRNLGDELQPHPVLINGTEAKRAHDITLRQFGSDESVVVSLRGPAGAVERQGRRLAAAIDAQPKTLVVSPWSPGGAGIEGLRPKPGVAGIVARIEHRGDEGLPEQIALMEAQIQKVVKAPVHASMAGLPRFFTSYHDANESAARTGELIAVPILLLVLLLVFRSVVAALIPVISGGVVVAATYGVMRLLLGFVEIESFALAAAGMMGLALGVDYALLVVSRFREEHAKSDLATAVQTTVEAAARSILPAAGGLLLAMLIAAQILPGLFVSSAALAVIIATALSAVTALTAVPAGVMLLGRNVDRWTLPRRFGFGGAPMRVSNRIVRSPRVVGAMVVLMLFLGGWAATLDSALATPQLLPPNDRGRVEEEQVEKALGPGWLAPIDVVLTGSGEPMTAPRRLHTLVAFQKRLEKDSGVQEVAGFNTIERRLHPLTNFEDRLVSEEHGVRRLHGGISRTHSGAERSSRGIRTAATGAASLGRGVESASDGAGLLRRGLRAAHTGSDQISAGLEDASEGTDKLAESSSKTSSSTGRLADGVKHAQDQVSEMKGNVHASKSAMRSGTDRLVEAQEPLGTAEARLAVAWQALEEMTTGTTDPQYAALQQSLREAIESLRGSSPESEEPAAAGAGVAAAITRAQRQFDLGLYLAGKIGEANEDAEKNTDKLARNTHRLDKGVQSLADGTAKMAAGIAELAKEGTELSPALQRLRAGTASLGEGLGRLSGSAYGLAGGLSGGARGTEHLALALSRLNDRLAPGSGSDHSPLKRLRRRSPDLFHSGYFYLAGLDGGNPDRREAATFMIDIGRGGHTARMLVIPREPITTAEGRRTFDQVRDDAHAFARSSGTEAVVGGLEASQLVLDRSLRDRTTLARVAMMLITLFILVLVLRSLTVPFIAAFLNLLTVSASFGIASILFNGSLLGGPGFVDSSVLPVAMMVIFGLAIDYEVFIFARMREEYVRTGSPTVAVDNGIARTGSVVTGAALIMITVLLSFSVSEFATMRNFGVIEAVAVFIDAFVVRLVVVPALMKWMGKWAWWMPKWLDGALPGREPAPAREASPA